MAGIIRLNKKARLNYKLSIREVFEEIMAENFLDMINNTNNASPPFN